MQTKLLASKSQFLRYLIHILQLLQHNAFSNTEVDYLWLSSFLSWPCFLSQANWVCLWKAFFLLWSTCAGLCYPLIKFQELNLVYWIGPNSYLDYYGIIVTIYVPYSLHQDLVWWQSSISGHLFALQSSSNVHSMPVEYPLCQWQQIQRSGSAECCHRSCV